MPPTYLPRKLLVAAVGVATVSYVAACGKENTDKKGTSPSATIQPFSGNLMPPPPIDAGVVPEPVEASVPIAPEAGTRTAAPDAGRKIKLPPTSGNLPAPRGLDGF